MDFQPLIALKIIAAVALAILSIWLLAKAIG